LVWPRKIYHENGGSNLKTYRSVVEIVIGLVKNWSVAGEVFIIRRASIYTTIAVMCCYELTAARIKQFLM